MRPTEIFRPGLPLCLLVLLLTLGFSGCLAPRTVSYYPALPPTTPVASPTVAGVAGAYVNGDRFNLYYSLRLRADGTYLRCESLSYCLAEPDGSFGGWANLEAGTWSLVSGHVHLRPVKHSVENPACQKEDFDAVREFEVRLRGTDRILLSVGGPRFPALLEEETNPPPLPDFFPAGPS